MKVVTRLRYLTHHYQDLQGYRFLPFVAFYLMAVPYDLWAGEAYALYVDRGEGAPTALATAGIGMIIAFLLAALASHQIGRWYETRYGYVAPTSRLAEAFGATTWSLVAICLLPLGWHSLLLLATGLGLVIHRTWTSPALLRHVPSGVLFLALGLHFPGIDTGLVQYVSPITAVSADLAIAAILLFVVHRNHMQLHRITAHVEAPHEVES